MALLGWGTNAQILRVIEGDGPTGRRSLLANERLKGVSQSTFAQSLHLLRKAGLVEDRIHLTPAGLRALNLSKARRG